MRSSPRPAGDAPVRMAASACAALPWKSVRSSNVRAIAYFDGHLFARFGPDSVYRYDDVPAEDHEALHEADRDPLGSVGGVLHRHIKLRYEYHRVEIKEEA